jgi:hypothetical protein
MEQASPGNEWPYRVMMYRGARGPAIHNEVGLIFAVFTDSRSVGSIALLRDTECRATRNFVACQIRYTSERYLS